MKFTLYINREQKVTGIGFNYDGERHCTYDMRNNDYAAPNEITMVISSNTLTKEDDLKCWENMCKEWSSETVEVEMKVTDNYQSGGYRYLTFDSSSELKYFENGYGIC